MKKITLLISISFFSWIGWWLGAHIGIMTAYSSSVIAAAVGAYYGVRFNQHYLN